MVVGVIGVVIGAAAILGVRFFSYSPEKVHYHANFEVYINGKREAFKNSTYYEEEGGGSCTADTAMVPEERAHMHDDASDVAHVEDHAVTWGQFFENLRWGVNDAAIKTRDTVYVADSTNHITYIINGHEVQDISTETIHDRDRLLVDFGTTSDSTLLKEFKAVPSTAAKFDEGKDPAACMSNAAPTMKERLQHLL